MSEQSKMSNETFTRENRYEVIKLSTGKKVDAIVIEKDWPEYELVWQMLENRILGNTAKVLEDKEREIAELKELLKDRQTDLDFEFNRAEQNECEINALNAHINDLREAFREIRSCYGDGYEVDNIARQALSKTPARSLQNITALKADARRWQYFRETASEEMCYELCGNSNPENEELNQAIDKRMNVTEND